jgi:tetratricopeptide (TPR) repeat protein
LEFRPGNVKVLSNLFTCHQCLKRERLANEYIQQALAAAKNLDDYADLISALLIFDAQYNRAIEVLGLAEARLPDIPPAFYVDMAGPLLKQHQKERADFWLQKAISKAALTDDVLAMIADMAMDFDEGVSYEYAQKALAANKNSGEAHLILGVLESKREHSASSRKHFREAERIARQTNDEELQFRIETARIYLAGPGALIRQLLDAGGPDLLDDFLDIFGKGL